MKKEKLIKKRMEKKFSQSEIAMLLNMEQSTYSRHENGETRISNEEWKKLSQILDCDLEDIYESDYAQTVNIDNSNAVFHDNAGNNNHYYNIPASLVHNLQDYIHHLKEQIHELKEELKKYKRN